jgi:predicted TIM-barrel fold metal-dependent hydrolase
MVFVQTRVWKCVRLTTPGKFGSVAFHVAFDAAANHATGPPMNRRRFLSVMGASPIVACASHPGPQTSEPKAATGTLASRLCDHHTHVFSEDAKSILEGEAGRKLPSFTATELLGMMDEGSIARAAVLSVAYFFSKPTGDDLEAARRVRVENDWVATQAAGHPSRLVAFFSVNPLSDGALPEVRRCASRGSFKGMKLHLANSKVDLRDESHVSRVQRVFKLAAELDLPVVVHLRSRRDDYGRRDVEAFIHDVLPSAGKVQVAHAGGWGGYDRVTDEAFRAFADAIERGVVDRKKLWFDVSAVVRGGGDYAGLTATMRRIGLDAFTFGSDWPEWTAASYRGDLERALGVERSELRRVLENAAPWLSS